ncbi:triple QxxK/R motif-containing protein isoform X1 [Carassius gibelio]|uniref:triple QxxK/R motif-containing protein isoform X1 n=1 Tax=Carassius gibelio TaxID=101364 RepID=UPI0022794521|nr:triple QxxK/R motif-containing protein isoform X1 [Carassius gibelio]
MGKKDASSVKLPVDQYRKQIGENLCAFQKTGLQENQAGAASHSAEGGGEEECSGNQGYHIGLCSGLGLPASRLCFLLPQPEHRAGSGFGHGLKDFS